nr:hypothetical protein [Tanacetum cinerariifolium]
DIDELFDLENVNAASQRGSAVIAPELVSTDEPTVFNDEDVTMTMAQTLIKLKVEKARILDEKIDQKLHDEEVQKESFKKLRAAEVLGSQSTQEIPTDDPKEITKEIIRVGGITEAYQIFKDILKGFDREDLVALWNLVKEIFSLVEPIEDKERALWEKDYPLSNAVMILMLSGKLHVEEDSELARDLVMKIFMEANRPRNISF